MISRFNRPLRRNGIIAVAAIALTAFATSANATPVVAGGNGTFSGTAGQVGYNATLSGWTSAILGGTPVGYNFLFTSPTATDPGQYGNMVAMDSLTTAAPAGNFVALDGSSGYAGPLSTTITGLTPGLDVSVTFYFAGDQQSGYSGASSQYLAVSLSDGVTTTTADTQTLSVASQGFTGWDEVVMNFDPTATTETLSFMAHGSPNGIPPFTLLSDVSVANTPEPGSLLLLSTGLLGLGGYVRRRVVQRQA